MSAAGERGSDDAWRAWQRALSAALAPNADEGAMGMLLSQTRGDPQTVARRLERWRGGRAVLYEDVLANAYPTVRAALGIVAFRELAACYVRRHPSRDGDLARFGARLAAFLAHDAATRAWRALAAVAQMDWAVHRLHGARDAPALAAADVARLSADALGRLQARLHPACRLQRLPRDAWRCWQAHHAGMDADAMGGDAAANTSVLVYRHRFRMSVREIGPAEWAALARLRRGCALAAVLEAAGGHTEDANAVGAMFARWLGDGVLAMMA